MTQAANSQLESERQQRTQAERVAAASAAELEEAQQQVHIPAVY